MASYIAPSALFFSLFAEYVVVCASRRHLGILGGDKIGRLHRSSDSDRGRLEV